MSTGKDSFVGLSCMARSGSVNIEFSHVIPCQISDGFTRSVLFQYQTKPPVRNKNGLWKFIKLGSMYLLQFVLIAEYSLITHFEHGHKLRPPDPCSQEVSPTSLRKNGINIRYICQAFKQLFVTEGLCHHAFLNRTIGSQSIHAAQFVNKSTRRSVCMEP